MIDFLVSQFSDAWLIGAVVVLVVGGLMAINPKTRLIGIGIVVVAIGVVAKMLGVKFVKSAYDAKLAAELKVHETNIKRRQGIIDANSKKVTELKAQIVEVKASTQVDSKKVADLKVELKESINAIKKAETESTKETPVSELHKRFGNAF